jgi:hypothetical protein
MTDQSNNRADQLGANAHWQTERRDKMAADGLRSLLLLNGGGAVALLAFTKGACSMGSSRNDSVAHWRSAEWLDTLRSV